jgi:hypothetical protein
MKEGRAAGRDGQREGGRTFSLVEFKILGGQSLEIRTVNS